VQIKRVCTNRSKVEQQKEKDKRKIAYVYFGTFPNRVGGKGNPLKTRKHLCPPHRVAEHGRAPADAALLRDTAAVLGDTLEMTSSTLPVTCHLYSAVKLSLCTALGSMGKRRYSSTHY
jgi:hypothetical protein